MQLRGAARHGFPFWVIIGGLDCSLKNINDTFGQHTGDAVLRRFAIHLFRHCESRMYPVTLRQPIQCGAWCLLSFSIDGYRTRLQGDVTLQLK